MALLISYNEGIVFYSHTTVQYGISIILLHTTYNMQTSKWSSVVDGFWFLLLTCRNNFAPSNHPSIKLE